MVRQWKNTSQSESSTLISQPLPTDSINRLTVDAKRLAKLLSAGLRTVRAWDVAGKLPKPVKLGGRVLWYLPEIHEWLQAGCPDRATWEAIKAARSSHRAKN